MNNIFGRELSNVRIHAGYHVQGVGSIPTSLDARTWKASLKMIKTETGVLCSVLGDKNAVIEFFFPDTNCIGFTFKPIEKSKDSK